MPRFTCCFVFGLLIGFALSPARAEGEWPQFRGPGGQGHAAARDLPLNWSESQNVAWKTAIPGRGHSSPVISGDQIWLTTAVATPLPPEEVKARLSQVTNPRGLSIVGHLSLRAVCVDRDSGRLVKNVPLFSVDDPEPVHTLNSYASPTPVIAAGRLYCHFGTYGTACLDTQTGKVLWRNADLHVDHQNGAGSSPILWRDLVIVHFDGIDRQFVAAFSTQDGHVVWRTPRSGKMNDKPEFQKAYATPLIVDEGGRVQLISPAADWVYSYDPADGEELWRAHYGQLGFSTVPRPVVGNGMVYLCTSFLQSRLLAVRYDGQGDVTKTHVVWHSDRQVPRKPSLLVVDDLLYLTSDNGVATCLNALTGKEQWTGRLGGEYSASPLYADGRLYFFSQAGKTVVLRPGARFTVLATNELSEGIMASPAAAGRALFLRTDRHLYRIEKQRAAAK